MKPSFVRNQTSIALCGLTCELCPMFVDRYCPGCGGGPGNQVCAIARCSQSKTNVSFCFECNDYPCDKYRGFNESDSFITHQNHHANLMRIKAEGLDVFKQEIQMKRRILDELLLNYNDGRHKRFYCLAVNLLNLDDLSEVMKSIRESNAEDVKLKAKQAKDLFTQKAKVRNLSLRLRK